jgi:hypothetical protein
MPTNADLEEGQEEAATENEIERDANLILREGEIDEF